MSTLAFHLACLEKTCRVCGVYQGEKCTEYKYNLNDNDLGNKVLQVFGVDVGNDDPNIHPTKLCNNCYAKCMKGQRDPAYNTIMEAFNWKKHEDHYCCTCEKFHKDQRGGRKRKGTMGRGRPKKSTMPNHAETVNVINISSAIVPIPIISVMPEINRFLNPPADLVCCICKEIFERPVQSSCQHYFCYNCIRAWLEHTGESSKCPVCTQVITASTLSKVPRVFLSILGSLCVTCVSCKSAVPLDRLESHENQCSNYVAQPCSIPLTQVHDTPITTPLSTIEETVTTHLMKRKLQLAKSSQVVLKTGGTVGRVKITTTLYRPRIISHSHE